MSNDDVESQELFVWNNNKQKYDLVDFKKLIEIAENKEIKNIEVKSEGSIAPDDNQNSDSISNDFNEDDLSLWLTSDKKEDKKKYNLVLKLTVKSVSGLVKIHQLSYKGDLDPSNAYFRYFFENTESLDSFSDYLIEAGTHWIVEKDYNGLILTIGPKN
jgi:hypothetical protein